jgi:hypothetical protein
MEGWRGGDPLRAVSWARLGLIATREEHDPAADGERRLMEGNGEREVGDGTGMRSVYFCLMRSASALRFSNGCSSLNLDFILHSQHRSLHTSRYLASKCGCSDGRVLRRQTSRDRKGSDKRDDDDGRESDGVWDERVVSVRGAQEAEEAVAGSESPGLIGWPR